MILKYKYFLLNKLIGLGKIFLALLSFSLTYMLVHLIKGEGYLSWGFYSEIMVFYSIVSFFVFMRENEYPKFPRMQIRDMMYASLKDILLLLGLLAIFLVFTKKQNISRLLLLALFFIQFTLFAIYRVIVDKIITKKIKEGRGRQNIIVIGSYEEVEWFIKRVNKNVHWGIDVLGKMIVSGSIEENHVPIVRNYEELENILKNSHIDMIIITIKPDKLKLVLPIITLGEALGTEVSLMLEGLFKPQITKMLLLSYEYLNFLTFSSMQHNYSALLIKEIFDRVFSFIAIVLLSPLFLVVSAIIKFTSEGPVFFVQTRVGRNGQLFNMYKFRSMYKDAEKRKKELMDKNEMGKVVFKIKNDPRITPIGKFIRKYSIDELPQLINIVKGEMSFIGPRPPLPEEVAQYEPWQRRRLSMKPGLSCLWQISGRNDIDFDEWMLMDLKYIDNWTLWLDFVIFIKTIIVVLTGKGAY